MAVMERLVDRIARYPEPLGRLLMRQALAMDEVEHLALAARQVGDEPAEVVGILDALALVAGGGIPVVGQRVVGLRARVEAAHRPLDDLPDDVAEGHAVRLAPLELGEQAEQDGLGLLVGGLAVTQTQEAELADGVEVAASRSLWSPASSSRLSSTSRASRIEDRVFRGTGRSYA